AVGSMDFGSGFLDDEEVDNLRALAVVIGANPWEATPSNFRPKFCPFLPNHNLGNVEKSRESRFSHYDERGHGIWHEFDVFLRRCGVCQLRIQCDKDGNPS